MSKENLVFVGTVKFRGYCESKYDKEKKNRLTLVLTTNNIKVVRERLREIYERNNVPHNFRTKFVTDDTIDIVSFSSKYDLHFSEYDENTGTFTNLIDGDIYSIKPGALVGVNVKIKEEDGRVGLYPSHVRIYRNGEDFNPFDEDVDWKNELEEVFN